MRNLKKILALVLALVMSFSLMATANAFTDDKDIDATYDEAVTVLSNLKVFQGYENGSFQPKGEITRAEVAAIIYRIVTGDVNDAQVAIYKDYNKFNDVKSTSWYAGYVNYCANAEYIKGYDAKTFGPNDKVTGYQALAMILRAVGYDKNGEFTGSGWQVKVASTANQLGVSRNVTAGTLGGSATREVVAELLFRTIAEAYIVEYTVAFGYQPVKLSGSTASETAEFKNTLGFQTFGLALTEGEITAVGYKAGTTTITPYVDTRDFADALGATDVVVTNTDANWENIGYAAHVYTVPTAGAKTRAAVSDVTVTGESVAVNTAETLNEASLNGRSIQPLINTSSQKIATLDPDISMNTTTPNTYRVYYNGQKLAFAPNATTPGYWWDHSNGVVRYGTTTAGSSAVQVVNGLKVDFVDNDNSGYAEAIVFTEYTTAQVLGIANESNTGVNAIVRDTYYFNVQSKAGTSTASVKTADLVCDSELAVGNLVTYVQYGGDTYVTLAPAAVGKFTQINYSTITRQVESYVIGDQTYELANDEETESGYVQDYFQGIIGKLDRSYVGKELAVYTDPYGYIIYVDENLAATNYLYVVRTNHSDNVAGTTYATVAFADGAVENVYLTRDNAQWFTTIASEMYAYTVNSAGNYKLGKSCTTYPDTDTPEDEMRHVSNVDYTTGSANLVAGSAYITNSTVVVDLRDVIGRTASTATVYTGYSEIPSVTGAEFHYVVGSNGFVTLAFLTDGTNTANLAKEFVVYHTNAHFYSQDANGAKYYTLTVITDGKLGEVTLDEDQYIDVCTYGVGMYSYNAKGVLTYTSFAEEWADITWQNGAIVVDGYGYTYGTIPFFTLDIARGNAYDYVMNFGVDTTSAKAVVITNNKGQATEIYVVYGTEATAATTGVTTVAGTGNQASKTYYVKNTMVTGVKEEATLTNNLRLVEVLGETVEATGEGAGTQADPFTYVAQVCNTAISGTAPRLRVMDNNVAAAMELWDKTVTTQIGEKTGVGEIADQGTAVMDGSLWMVKSDGVWYSVKVVVLSEAATLTSSDATKIKVDGDKIQIAASVADEADTKEDVAAALNQYLEVAAGATMTYDEDSVKVTVEPACKVIHKDHVAVYTVEFVTAIV